ncbi:hypothetical protein AAVH_33337 [Aphelenchoides avenae]|nr:hypothetical protein AAVH_33337 [Aphelenchus avenae]
MIHPKHLKILQPAPHLGTYLFFSGCDGDPKYGVAPGTLAGAPVKTYCTKGGYSDLPTPTPPVKANGEAYCCDKDECNGSTPTLPPPANPTTAGNGQSTVAPDATTPKSAATASVGLAIGTILAVFVAA